jgi:hypothetical protein
MKEVSYSFPSLDSARTSTIRTAHGVPTVLGVFLSLHFLPGGEKNWVIFIVEPELASHIYGPANEYRNNTSRFAGTITTNKQARRPRWAASIRELHI